MTCILLPIFPPFFNHSLLFDFSLVSPTSNFLNLWVFFQGFRFINIFSNINFRLMFNTSWNGKYVKTRLPSRHQCLIETIFGFNVLPLSLGVRKASVPVGSNCGRFHKRPTVFQRICDVLIASVLSDSVENDLFAIVVFEVYTFGIPWTRREAKVVRWNLTLPEKRTNDFWITEYYDCTN